MSRIIILIMKNFCLPIMIYEFYTDNLIGVVCIGIFLITWTLEDIKETIAGNVE